MKDEKADIRRLEIVPLRQAFPSEARNFTRWLETNIEALSERIGMHLTVIQREQSVGDFNVDLLCEDAQDRHVIIENQLERTDHTHLGQILTYLVNLEAKIAIWVAADPRPEHQNVINWLNASTPIDTSFYLVKVEAIRIGDSPFAPLFTVIARPDKQAKEIGGKKKEWADRHYSRFEFWKGLLAKSNLKTSLFASISPVKDNWIGKTAGKNGVSFNYYINMEDAAIALYIDHDRQSGAQNKATFDALLAHREEIENEFGSPLDWLRLDNKRSSRIEKRFSSGGLSNPDTWAQLQDDLIDPMIQFEKVMRTRLTSS